MAELVIIIVKPPYGSEDAFALLNIALAALSQNLSVAVILTGDGVYCGLRNQRSSVIGYPSVENYIYSFIAEVAFFACEESLKSRGVSEEDLIEEIEVASREKIAEVIKNGETIIAW